LIPRTPSQRFSWAWPGRSCPSPSCRNVGVGIAAGQYNQTASDNTAVGYFALNFNTAPYNTAVGARALLNNTTGNRSTAVGRSALRNNTTGGQNVAVGQFALYTSTVSDRNTSVGSRSMENKTTGYWNTALGYGAGYNWTTGNNNIAISNTGVAAETATTRIGSAGIQTRTFISGIRGITTGVADAVTVMIDSAGQLGTVSSSRRFKEDIVDMGDATDRLLDLRTVLFKYKERNADGDGPIEFGLIAEEVAGVFPELVVYDDEGRPETVKYHLPSTMLLNEMQRMQREVTRRDEAQDALIAALTERLAAVEQRE
jgi:hypothetical protein